MQSITIFEKTILIESPFSCTWESCFSVCFPEENNGAGTGSASTFYQEEQDRLWYSSGKGFGFIGSNGLSSYRVYPNPATDKCRISLPKDMEGKELNVDVMDINGRILYSQKEQDTEIDLSKFETGLYFINIAGEGVNYDQKLVKQ